MSSGASEKNHPQPVQHEWELPSFKIPEGERWSSILKYFTSDEQAKAAYAAWKQGYIPIKSNLKYLSESRFLKFGKFFLRENCQCPKCIHPDTRQKITDTFSIPVNIDVTQIELNPTHVKVGWTDCHESSYSWDWLVAHDNSFIEKPQAKSSELPPMRELFTPYQKDQPYPEVNFDEVMSKDSALLDWLWKIYTVGFCFINGVPATPDATKPLIERIAFIRHTHYGGFWDFTADLTFKDTAYTNEFLGGHTDNTYFTDPARLQLFHLLSHTDGSGGESLLVDAFDAAEKLKTVAPHLYESLASEKHSWHSSGNEDVCIQPAVRAPVLSPHGDTGAVYQVRWNDYDRAPKSDWPIERQTLWYEAARRFNSILNEGSRQIVTQLQPGTALIFDNWRMLHGRSEFTGKRRMCGGYVNNDDFISRLRLLKFGREKVLNSLGTTSIRYRYDEVAETEHRPADIY